MRRWFYGGALVSWIVAAGAFIQADLHHHLLSLVSIIAYNRPQGVFGWALVLAVVLTGLSISAYKQHQYLLRQQRK
ncbi:hypothetical protein [Levilactobacillus parabrevis]|uniref:hypothetical protein n=1 Tax=Levilactobacillus parabrevis TaxID=357278 RepID=UPI000376E408|nr:hypothetical protein [Levilactobacillus parabrevis]